MAKPNTGFRSAALVMAGVGVFVAATFVAVEGTIETISNVIIPGVSPGYEPWQDPSVLKALGGIAAMSLGAGMVNRPLRRIARSRTQVSMRVPNDLV